MKTLELTEAMAPLVDYVREANAEPVILTSRGKPVAALLPITGDDLETVSLSTNPAFLAIIERSRARQQAEGGISSEEIRRRLDIPAASPRKGHSARGGR
jgi:prevent-host-death family protein